MCKATFGLDGEGILKGKPPSEHRVILFRRKELIGVPYRIEDSIEQCTDKHEKNQNSKNFHVTNLPSALWPLRFFY